MTTELKSSTKLRLLIQVVRNIHNPQVIEAYPIDLDGQSSQLGETGSAILRKWLTIDADDQILVVILKILAFYLGCGRLVAVATIPVDFAVKAMALRPQLCIVYHPISKRVKGEKRSGNYQSTIPHFNGSTDIRLPIYTVGQHTCIYKLIDNSYIMTNAKTVEEATKVTMILASYTDEKFRPPGEIKDNLKITKRSGKQLKNITLSPHRVDYYEGRGKGFTALWSLNIKPSKIEDSE